MMSARQGGFKYNLWVFGMTWPGIEPRSPVPFVNTLIIWPMAQLTMIKKKLSLIIKFISIEEWTIDKEQNDRL